MAFSKQKLVEALSDLAEPVPLGVLFSHVATVEPEPTDAPEQLLKQVKTVLNLAISEGTVLKAKTGYFLAPTVEAVMAEEDKDSSDEEEANIVSEVEEQLVTKAFLELHKLESKQQPDAEQHGLKRKQQQPPVEIGGELDNTDKRRRIEAERATGGESQNSEDVGSPEDEGKVRRSRSTVRRSYTSGQRVRR